MRYEQPSTSLQSDLHLPEDDVSELATLDKRLLSVCRNRSIDKMTADRDIKALELFNNAMARKLEIVGEQVDQEKGRRQAEEIFGRDYIGPELAEKVFAARLTAEQIPPIPFSVAELRRAKELNQYLILRIDGKPDGTPITIARMQLVASIPSWLGNEPFFLHESPRPGWALVTKENLVGSTNKYYWEQTTVLHDYFMEKVCRGVGIPDLYSSALRDFFIRRKDFPSYGSLDHSVLASRLDQLQIDELLRPTAVEYVYDTFLYYISTGTKLITHARIGNGALRVDDPGVITRSATNSGQRVGVSNEVGSLTVLNRALINSPSCVNCGTVYARRV